MLLYNKQAKQTKYQVLLVIRMLPSPQNLWPFSFLFFPFRASKSKLVIALEWN